MPLTGAALLDDKGPIARLLDGYEPRPVQLDMAHAVDALIAQADGRLLVEAGTGVGKSLAYLAPTLASGVLAVIATGTKALQDQLARDDAPLVCRALAELGHAVPRVEVVKGRRNYVCHERLARLLAEPDLPGLGTRGTLEQVWDWAQSSATGDRAELDELPDGFAPWEQIDAGAETCVGPRCQHREACFIVRLRERARAADLIITNHHLLMADEALRLMQRFGEVPESAQLLPDHALLIVDEAHALHAVATEAFSASVSSGQIERLCRDVRADLGELERAERAGLRKVLRPAEQGVASALRMLVEASAGDGRQLLVPSTWDLIAQRSAKVAQTKLGRLAEALCAQQADNATMQALAARAVRLQRALAFVLEATDPTYVYFAERRGRGVRLAAAPIEVADPLAETLFRPGRQVVLTSATLCTDRGFASTRQLLGLNDEAAVSELQLASPFPYRDLVRLYLPEQPIIPDSPEHLERLAEEMRALCDAAGGGAFLLFTSYRALDEVHRRIAPQLNQTVLRQGEAPRRALIERFRADGDAVLFGTHSFWEGVDVRGRALRLVAIDRLPFASPKDPLYTARSRLMESRGDNPFVHLAVPQAILELKQGVGRLVRSSTDRGVIALLDGRVQTRGYGRRFLRALPPAQKIKYINQVKEFFEIGSAQ